MDIEPFLISSALKLIVSQRLVKRLCPKCAKSYKITDDVMKGKVAGYLSNVIEDKIDDIDFYKSAGCEACDMS